MQYTLKTLVRNSFCFSRVGLFLLLICLFRVNGFAQLSIQSFSPVNVKTGDTVTIQGSGFQTQASQNKVNFNHKPGKVISATSSTMLAIVPAGISYGFISISTGGFSAISKQAFLPNIYQNKIAIHTSDFPVNFFTKTDSNVLYVATADVDGDRFTDIIAGLEYPARISILKNISTTDSINFAPGIDIPLSGKPFLIEIADIHGDGRPDIIAIDSAGSNQAHVLRNNCTPGTLSFNEEVALTLTGLPRDMIIADIDSDGKLDISCGTSNANSLDFFRNTSTETTISFTKMPLVLGISSIGYLVHGDYNNDGKIDIIAGQYQGGGVLVLKNNSSGSGIFSFKDTVMYGFPLGGFDAVSGDVNRDRKTDLVISAIGIPPSVLLNISNIENIRFEKMTFELVGGGNGYVSLSDLNYDGNPDILVGKTNSTFFPSLHQNLFSGDFLFGPVTHIFNVALNFAAADFDNNQSVDFVGSSYFLKKIQVYKNLLTPIAIQRFNPTRATKGTPVTISGYNFHLVSDVSFGGIMADSFTVVNDSLIIAFPGQSNSGSVALFGKGIRTLKDGFIYYDPPVITSFTPNTGIKGSEVIINGNNLNEVRIVTFGGIIAATFTILNNTQIKAMVGEGATGYVTIGGSAYDSSRMAGFTYFPGPDITNVSSLQTAPDNSITLTGNYFSNATQVTLGGIVITPFTVAGSNTITFNALPYIIGGSITVKTPFGTDSIFGFYNGAHIDDIIPLKGKARDTITIYGKGFGNNPSQVHAFIGFAKAEIISIMPERIEILVPFGPTSGSVSLSLYNHTISGNQPFAFTFDGAGEIFDQTSLFSILPKDLLEIDEQRHFSIADIDLDGKPDIIQPGYNRMIIYRNTGMPGTFQFQKIEIPLVNYASGYTNLPELADLNYDGKPDFVLHAFSSMRVDYMLNISTPGHIKFEPNKMQPFSYNNMTVMTVDADKDGRMDYIFNPESYETPSIILNTSTPDSVSFKTSWDLFFDYYGTSNVQLADFNNDGQQEYLLQKVNIYASSSLFAVKSIQGKILGIDSIIHFDIDCNSAPYLLADFDNDNKTDLLDYCDGVSIKAKRNISSSSEIKFAEHSFAVRNTSRYKASFAADFNGDGKSDFAAFDEPNKIVDIFINETTGTHIHFASPISFPLIDDENGYEGEYKLDVADLDMDGRPDIMISAVQTEQVQILRNLTGTNIHRYFCADQPGEIKTQSTGTTYQWQQSVTGSGYTNMDNNASFVGTQTRTLSITNIGTALYGKYFRCLVNGKPDKATKIKLLNTWTGDADNLWSNPANWDCGFVPTGPMDVVINGNITVDIDITIGSIQLLQGGNISVAPGKKVTIFEPIAEAEPTKVSIKQ